jgi:hypothetical protein
MIDHETFDAEAVLGEIWPLNGPYGEYESENAASALAELVHYLNYATRTREALPYPSVAGSVIEGTARAVGGLDQTFDQIASRIGAFQASPYLYGDGMGADEHASGAEHAERALAKLAQARRDAAQLRQTLADAASHLARLGMRTDDWEQRG